ncbi:MAG: SDR family oxidoreductase [Akkermansiaceae bacterium]|nr:SDR family oxidoreductase [Akkermansiaceae bacterium]
MSRLRDKVVVVTGGSGLIGRALLENIRREGGTPVNADLNPAAGDDWDFVRCDITSEDDIRSLVEQVVARHGRIDGWVNNAYPRTKDWGAHFEDIPDASWKRNVDVQMNSVFTCCQHVLKHMGARGGGSIVNIASVYGVVGPDFGVYDGTPMTMPAAYSAIKGGIVNFTRYLASYYGPRGVRVNCVSPGGVFDHQPEEFVNQYVKKTPLRRMAAPEDITPAVAFLLSDEASYVTGHNLMVDGGWTCI